MFRPVGTAGRPLAGPIEFRAIITRARKARTLVAAAIVAGAVKARLVETTPAFTFRTRITLAAIIPPLPRLVFASLGTIAKILAWTAIAAVALAIRSAPGGKFPLTAEFSLRPVATGAIAIARWPGAERPIATRTVAVLAKACATRRIRPLLAATLARGIRLAVAKLPVGRTSRRARIVAIPRAALAIPVPPWWTVVAIEIRAIAARRVRALVAATIFTRLEGTPFAVVTAGRTAGKWPVAARAWRIAIIPARRTIIAVALAGIRLPIAGIRLLAERFCAIGFPGIGTPFPVAFALSGKSALGELLLRPPRRPGAALAATLAAARPVTPAAGIVVFVVIAGHEWSLGYR